LSQNRLKVRGKTSSGCRLSAIKEREEGRGNTVYVTEEQTRSRNKRHKDIRVDNENSHG
jgi:hypothetical protein